MSALLTSGASGPPAPTGPALWVSVVDSGHGQAVRAADLDLLLERQVDGYWEYVKLEPDPASGAGVARPTPAAGRYRLTLGMGRYHAALGARPPITDTAVTFWIADAARDCRLSVSFTGHAQFVALCTDTDEPAP